MRFKFTLPFNKCDSVSFNILSEGFLCFLTLLCNYLLTLFGRLKVYAYIYRVIQKQYIMTTISKYNRSEIMKAAWELFRTMDGIFTFSQCLKNAWSQAKQGLLSSSLKDESVKYIFDRLDTHDVEFEEILETVKNNSKGFQKDVAEKGLRFGSLSTKQAWCVAYEYKKVA